MNRPECPRCMGTGTEPDHEAIGRKMWNLRRQSGLTMAVVAERMGIDKSYVSYLEAGKRDWNAELVAAYKKAVAP